LDYKTASAERQSANVIDVIELLLLRYHWHSEAVSEKKFDK